ncbi:hypothetical protein [Actinomycetospora soli]|uniref:hypothetical protein n=1 Tax=Actinomycetospora soli TaxID=2893887 RepID=UPI001E454FE7|nr:hypothetical protein [Actinomycetospora soli]MCD2191716.1 hypothetical protein [Actinomycetospora soli]
MTTQPETPATEQATQQPTQQVGTAAAERPVPLVIEGVPDVVACEVGLAGCDRVGSWTAWARDTDPQRCCAACGGQMAGRPGVMVFPVIR